MYGGENSLFNNWCWTATGKIMNLEHYIYHTGNLNLKLNRLNVRLENIKKKFLEGKKGHILLQI